MIQHSGTPRETTRMGRWSWLPALLLAALGGVAGYAGSTRVEPVYESTTSLFVGSSSDTLQVTKEDIDTSILLASTYGALIRSETVLRSVIQELDLKTSSEELKDRVHVDHSVIPTPSFSVSVRAGSAEQASSIANAIADRTVALSPAGPDSLATDESQAFASRQAAKLERAIRAGERRILQLESRFASKPSAPLRASLRAKARDQFDLIGQWRANFALLKRLSRRASPNIVHVLEPGQAPNRPLRPNRTMFAGLGVIVGAVGGALLIAARQLRRSRDDRSRRSGYSIPDAVSDDFRAFDEAPTLGERDPWVQELTA